MHAKTIDTSKMPPPAPRMRIALSARLLAVAVAFVVVVMVVVVVPTPSGAEGRVRAKMTPLEICQEKLRDSAAHKSCCSKTERHDVVCSGTWKKHDCCKLLKIKLDDSKNNATTRKKIEEWEKCRESCRGFQSVISRGASGQGESEKSMACIFAFYQMAYATANAVPTYHVEFPMPCCEEEVFRDACHRYKNDPARIQASFKASALSMEPWPMSTKKPDWLPPRRVRRRDVTPQEEEANGGEGGGEGGGGEGTCPSGLKEKCCAGEEEKKEEPETTPKPPIQEVERPRPSWDLTEHIMHQEVPARREVVACALLLFYDLMDRPFDLPEMCCNVIVFKWLCGPNPNPGKDEGEPEGGSTTSPRPHHRRRLA